MATTVYLVERSNVPSNGALSFPVWLKRSSVESAERTRREFAEVDLAIVEVVGDFEYRIS